jgi:hypothetical protein
VTVAVPFSTMAEIALFPTPAFLRAIVPSTTANVSHVSGERLMLLRIMSSGNPILTILDIGCGCYRTTTLRKYACEAQAHDFVIFEEKNPHNSHSFTAGSSSANLGATSTARPHLDTF